jgi:large subunit ribosomal protein L3
MQLTEGRRTGALAMKVGMLAIWDTWGVRVPVTVLHLDACQVVQVKSDEANGYTAMQLGVGEAKASRVNVSVHYLIRLVLVL